MRINIFASVPVCTWRCTTGVGPRSRVTAPPPHREAQAPMVLLPHVLNFDLPPRIKCSASRTSCSPLLGYECALEGSIIKD